MIALIKKRYFLLFAIVFIADRLTKWLAVTALTDGQRAVCCGINFDLSWSRGVMWNPVYWLHYGALALMIIGLTWYIVWRLNRRLSIGCEALALVGAVSILIDYLCYGATIDFISWRVGPFAWQPLAWSVFNIASVCIFVGIVGVSTKMVQEMHG